MDIVTSIGRVEENDHPPFRGTKEKLLAPLLWNCPDIPHLALHFPILLSNKSALLIVLTVIIL